MNMRVTAASVRLICTLILAVSLFGLSNEDAQVILVRAQVIAERYCGDPVELTKSTLALRTLVANKADLQNLAESSNPHAQIYAMIAYYRMNRGKYLLMKEKLKDSKELVKIESGDTVPNAETVSDVIKNQIDDGSLTKYLLDDG